MADVIQFWEMHTGPGNTGMNYEMGGTEYSSKTVNEKNLGVTMNANLKVSEQCRIAASNSKAGSCNLFQVRAR